MSNNLVVYGFKSTLYRIMTSNSINNIIKYCKNGREKHWLEQFKKVVDSGQYPILDMPFPVLLNNIQSKELLKEIMVCMAVELNIHIDETTFRLTNKMRKNVCKK